MGGRRIGSAPRVGRCRRIGLALLLAAVLSLGQHWQPPVAHAATFTVSSTADVPDAAPGDGICRANTFPPRCTLRAAIEEANALAGADTISVPAGTYTLTLGQLQTTSSVTIEGAGMASTFVQAGTQPFSGTSRVFAFGKVVLNAPATRVILRNLTVRHGSAGFGGGVQIGTNTDVALEGVTVTGNRATGQDGGSGGGISNSGGKLTLRDSVVSNNRADETGGGVECGSAERPDEVTLTIATSTIASNVGRSGGGVGAIDCNVTMTASIVMDNEATGPDGGGGVFLNDRGTHSLTNVTISGNRATHTSGCCRGGAGLIFFGGDATGLVLDHVTFFGNVDSEGKAHSIEASSPSKLHIRNSLLVHQQSSGNNCALGGTTGLTSLGGNFEFPRRTCFVAAAQSGPADLTDFDPKLLPLANNGGPTLTHALAGASRAIDRIPFSAGACPTRDQRGLFRPKDGNGDGVSGCDSGAFEVQSAPVGTFTLAPSTASVTVGQRHTAALTWTVTQGTWHTLDSVQVRLREDGRDSGGSTEAHTALQFQWDQDANTVREVDPKTGRLGPPAALGSETVLESARAALDLKDSRIQGGGPTSPNVTFTMRLAFKPPTKGRIYTVEVAATTDGGASQDFAAAGTIAVER